MIRVYDATENKLYSLTDASKKAVSDIENEISLKTIAEVPLKENKNVNTELSTYEVEKSPSLNAFK